MATCRRGLSPSVPPSISHEYFQLSSTRLPPCQRGRQAPRRRQSAAPAEHDHLRHHQHRRLCGASRSHYTRRRRLHTPHHARHHRSREPAQHTQRTAPTRLRPSARGRRALQSQRGRHSRRHRGKSTHQPGQLRRPRTHFQTGGLHRRRICRRTAPP